MEYIGVLKKMKTEYLDEISYYLDMPNDIIHVNSLVNNVISLTFLGYQCLCCSQNKEIYRQGFCKSCFFDIPSAGDWIMKPELSKAHLGIEDRDLDYEKSVQLTPHIVYLANSSNVKVGVTRKAQVPTRWIDQGAHQALKIVEVPNRYLAGITEVALKKFVADKTNWRKMLKNDIEDINLLEWREKLKQYIPEQVKNYFIEGAKVLTINFPITKYPKKVKSLKIKDKEIFTGKLVGIKGQYLIFDDDTVFNVRANEGLLVKLAID